MEAGEERQLSTLSGVPKVPPDRHDLRCTSWISVCRTWHEGLYILVISLLFDPSHT